MAKILKRSGILVGWLAAVLCFVLPVAAQAATYYVSGSGSDKNPGTLAQPWQTVEQAKKVVAAGDTVYLRSGTYGAKEHRTTLSTSGTVSSPISWLAYPGDERPVFLGALRLAGAYNRVSGILLDGPSGPIAEAGGSEEVLVWLNAKGTRLDHSEIREGAWHAGVFVSGAAEFSIDHDFIHDNGVTFNLDQGIYVSSNSSGTIADNLVADNFAWGVQLYPDAEPVVVNHNTIVGNGRGGVIVADESTGSLIANNIVSDNNEYGIRAYELTGTGNEAVGNLVWNQEVNTTGTGMTFTGTTVSDPLFAGASDYHLEGSSPAVEAAGSPTISDDIEGVPRGNPSDLGAYEYVLVTNPPTLRSASSAAANASTTLAISKPAETASGDVLVAEVASRGGAAISAPKGWTEIRNTSKGTSERMTTFYKVANGEEPASYTFTSTDAFGKSGGIATWDHVDAKSPIVTSSGNTGTGTTITASGVTTLEPETALMAVAGINDQTTATPPGGFTERWDVASAGTFKSTSESSTALQAAAGASGSKTITAGSAGGGWEAQLIALRPE